MVFAYRAPANTQLSNQSGGTTSVNENRDVVVSWADSLEAWQTPHLTKAKKSGRFADNPTHTWGQSVQIPLDTTLGESINNSVTAFDLAAGAGKYMQAQAFVEIMDPRADNPEVPDESTRELLYITQINGDEITTAARGTYTPALTHSAGAFVRLVGTAEPENGQHAEAPRIRGFKLFNHPMRFNAKLTADKRMQNTPTWEKPSGNPHLEDFASEMEKQKELLERWMWIGARHRGVYTAGSELPSTFGGINTFLTTNTINMDGAMLGPGDMEAVMREIYYSLRLMPGGVWVMGMDESIILDSSINPIRRADVSDDSVNKVVRSYKTRVGSIDVEPSHNVPRGNLYYVNWQYINLIPYKGLDWHHTKLKGEDNAVDHDVDAISGDFTLEVVHEEAMARIYNFDMNLDNYPSAGYY